MVRRPKLNEGVKNMLYKCHVISTENELLTSGFRIPSRPDHNGVDFIDKNDLQITEKGVDIVAFADGKVVEVIKGNLVGNTVALLHVVDGKNYLTRYQHMRDGVSVKVNEYVKKGQKLGVMGNTGSCISSRTDIPPKYRGTHLHFAIKENSTSYANGVYVDPEPYLTGQKIFGCATDSGNFADTKPLNTVTSYKVGDIVQFIGGRVYKSSNTDIPEHSRVKSKCKVTQTYNGKHPYHLISEDDVGVYGWVDLADISPISDTTTAQIATGSKVKIKSGAKYYTGGVIPAWVASDTWIVSALNSDRAVLGMNVSGKNSIMSPINVKDLALV